MLFIVEGGLFCVNRGYSMFDQTSRVSIIAYMLECIRAVGVQSARFYATYSRTSVPERPLAICFYKLGNPTFVELTVSGLYATGDSAVLLKILA